MKKSFTPLHKTLTYRLHLLHKATDHETYQLYQERIGLGLSECRCLASIGTFSPLSVNHLAQATNLNKAQASRAAQALVQKGLVIKTPDPIDKRGVILNLSKEGQVYWEKVMMIVEQRNEEIFSSLSAEQLAQFSSLLDQLIASLPPST